MTAPQPPLTEQEILFGMARLNVRDAIRELQTLRARYQSSTRLPAPVAAARVRGLDSKIAALGSIMLDGRAVPWCEDEL